MKNVFNAYIIVKISRKKLKLYETPSVSMGRAKYFSGSAE